MWVVLSFVYLSFLVGGTLIAVTGSSWFVVWMGLEMNMMSFIPLVNLSSKINSEALFSYFLVQVIGSLLLFYVGVVGSIWVSYGNFMYDVFSSGGVLIMLMALKLGASPVHFWFPSVVEGLDWFGVLMLMTWQSVAPLSVVSVVDGVSGLILVIGVLSVIVGGFGGLNQLLLRKLMAYSSISHLGWLCLIVVMSEWVGLVYFVSYVMVSSAVIFCFMFSSFVHVGQLYSTGYGVIGLLAVFYLGLFSLGGLPPLFGFFPKWLGIILMAGVGYLWVVMFFVVVGLLTLYFYLRMGYVGLVGFTGFNMWSLYSFSVVLFSSFFLCATYFLLPFSVFSLL
uniref:NADH-ubiquinone oxidoreductase chain 2 n=1 Tax=Appalachioria falcifera TaxID=382869 RepID=S4SZW7_APPFA|nr:NADH dehydrogenase subunit 2 [Appalachioria falcifera]AFR77027.1 NADH dehydrogenase subunit 2 [Appalachioria falcifera]